MPRLLLALSLALTPTLTLPAADWTQFRGPTAQGHADDARPPTEWSPSRNVAWKLPVPGLGWSSPVVSGGTVFLTTAVPRGDGPKPDYSLRVLRVSQVKAGVIVWDKEVFREEGADAPAIHK